LATSHIIAQNSETRPHGEADAKGPPTVRARRWLGGG
jgi:hypothetical protein